VFSTGNFATCRRRAAAPGGRPDARAMLAVIGRPVKAREFLDRPAAEQARTVPALRRAQGLAHPD